MPNGLPLEQAREYLKSLDLSNVAERMVRVEKWKLSEAEEAVEQYRNFLYLQKKYGAEFTLSPSEDMDEAWHSHILHTREYVSFCEVFFGKYLHHEPQTQTATTLVSQTSKMFKHTQELYCKEFGDFIYSCREEFIGVYLFKRLMAILKNLSGLKFYSLREKTL